MFRVLDVLAEGEAQTSEGTDRVAMPEPGAFKWVDLSAQDTFQLEVLRQRFQFHPLALEDCAHFDQRPKLEEYNGHLFIVNHGFSCEDVIRNEIEILEVHAFLGDRFLVTVHSSPIPALDAVWSRLASDPAAMRRGMDFVYYLIADGMVDRNFPILDRLSDELESIETAVLSSPEPDHLATMFRLKRLLVAMRKALSPQRDVFALLAKRGGLHVGERTALYFRDVYDHLVRLNESIETGRDLLGNCFDAYLSAVSNRTNEIMKRLTLMSAIFLPLAFVVGFFGQNFQNLPFLRDWVTSDALMWIMVGSCVAIPVAMLAWFRQSKWI